MYTTDVFLRRAVYNWPLHTCHHANKKDVDKGVHSHTGFCLLSLEMSEMGGLVHRED